MPLGILRTKKMLLNNQYQRGNPQHRKVNVPSKVANKFSGPAKIVSPSLGSLEAS